MAQDHHNLPLVDPADGVRRAGGRPEVATELFAMLRRDLPATAAALRSARDASDLDALREAAHRLLGAALYCGVPRLREQAREVERLCIEGDAAGALRDLPALLETMEAVGRVEDPLAAESPR
ncbi:MAG: Hpt domain-containing protein [Halofilum sp. (in: g-proteobacteria)]|nr:Hpt domain-containing protein [Halofilum sp. (in: g-proteobacteria)]